MCKHFGALDIKVLKCQVCLKTVRYINIKDTRLWNEQKKLWKKVLQMGKFAAYWKMN